MTIGSRPRSLAFWLLGVAWMGGVAQAQLRGVTAALSPLVETDSVTAGTEIRAALQVTLPEGFHVQSDDPRDPALIPTVLTVEPPPGVSVVELAYPGSTDLVQAGSDQPLAVFEQQFVIGLRLMVRRDVPPGDLIVPGRLRYQACNDTTCFAPATARTEWTLRVAPQGTPAPVRQGGVFDHLTLGRGAAPPSAAPTDSARGLGSGASGQAVPQLDGFTILGSAGGYFGSEAFLTFVRNAEAGVKQAGWFEGRGPLAIFLSVLLGGLALNLTPCVLPMIPINLAIIGAGARAGSRRRGFLLGATYGGAMALVYGVLGVIVILTAGTFGAINASPWFNLGIAALFIGLGLAMFDLVTIDFSRFSPRFSPLGSRRGTVLVAFSMGGVAALLAGACVAPVVIQVVLFSSSLYATGTSAALALPFVLGLGMALPWPIAGAGVAVLPKPGAWMVRVKEVLGIVILATAAYYAYTAYGLFASRRVDPGLVASSVEAKLEEGWHASLGEGLSVAQREQKPVLIDLWATWCKNCLTMDRTTLADPAVRAALSGYIKIKVQAEDPDEPATMDIMRRFGAVGLPAYVILKPGP